MIIKRLSKGIKEQDWFVVTIEVMVVVVGLFIGLQVDDWNEARLDDAKSQMFTDRLLNDLQEEVFVHAYFLAYNEDVLESAEATLGVLTSSTEMSNEEFLINAFRASQYTWWAKLQTTLEELISTGQLDLIKETQLRSIALAVYGSPLLKKIENRGRESPYRDMFRSLIPMDVHRSLQRHCGDITVLLGEYEKLDKLLSSECKLDLPQSKIESAVNMLKADSTLIPLLRLRVAYLDSHITQLTDDSDYSTLLDYMKSRSDT